MLVWLLCWHKVDQLRFHVTQILTSSFRRSFSEQSDTRCSVPVVGLGIDFALAEGYI